MSEQPKNETIRHWYQRTTRRARKAILYASVASFVIMALSWSHMSISTMGRIQTFNGALTVPFLAVIWTSALVFMFLRPTREAAFRSQESMDAGIKSLEGRMDLGIKDFDRRVDTLTKMFSEALNNKIIPAMDCWNRVGQRIEKVVVDGLFDEMKLALKEIKATAAHLDAKATEGNGELKRFVADTKPVIEALKRVHTRLDKELGDGFVDDLRSAMQSVRELGGMPSANARPTVLPVGPRPAPAAPAPEPEPVPVPAFVSQPASETAVPVVEAPITSLSDTSHPVVIEKPTAAPSPAAPAPAPAPAEPDLDRALRVIKKREKKEEKAAVSRA